MADTLQSSRKSADEWNDGANNHKPDSAYRVSGQNVHGNAESQNMRAHDEYEEGCLGKAANFTTDGAHENFTCVTHGVNVGLSLC